jgi:putative cell wall-binding protein
VDRRFNRSRYDTEKVMDRFSENLRDGVDGSEMVRGWVDVVSETMQPSVVSVWVRNDSGTLEG